MASLLKRPQLAAPARAGRRSTVAVRASGGNTYGHMFRVTTFGESHGKGVGCIIDGVPPRLAISEAEIQVELDRRKPGQSIITTPRKEEDVAEILSGVADGVTLGTPIAILVRNKDQKSQDYSEMSVAYRPSHADATYDFKYGIRAVAGGGRSSARETIGRVAAGAVAKKLLRQLCGTEARLPCRRPAGRAPGAAPSTAAAAPAPTAPPLNPSALMPSHPQPRLRGSQPAAGRCWPT
jgi:chorismate synthase